MFSVAAQSSIEGVVLDEENNPLAFTNVLLFNAADSSLNKGTITDIEGNYAIDNVSAGTYFLKASQVGYTDVETGTFDFADGAQTPKRFDLQFEKGVELEEIVVTSQRPLIEMEADKIVMNIENSPVATGNSALEVLEKSPGVIVDQDNNISLKGKQGVLILIDGKNQYVSNEQLTRLLETMPANSIQKIEIIHNPSSKYDASGNAGIINIKLKKKENLGYNGTLTAGAGQGRYPKGNAGLSLNYRGEKYNVYGSYDFRHWEGFQDINISRSVPIQNDFTFFDQNSDFLNNSNSNNYKIGMDYYLGENTTIGILSRGSFGNWSGENDNFTNITGLNFQGFDRSNTLSDVTEDWDQIAGNLNLQHQFSSGAELSVDFDYSRFNNPTLASYDNFFFDTEDNAVMDPFYLRNSNDVAVDILASKADYSFTSSNGIKFETGLKISAVTTDNNTLFENMIDGVWTDDVSLSNEFNYEEDIIAAYTNASKSFGAWTLQTGLRWENTMSDGFSVTLDERVKQRYNNFFPSASLSRTLGDKHNFSFSYSRRIDRPTYRRLNPFLHFLDQFTFEKGNPFLAPQISNSYGINYGLQNKLFVTANYSRTTNAMTQVIDQNDQTQQTFQTTVNLDNFNNYSLNVTAPIVINNVWSTRWSLTGFYNDFESTFAEGNINKDQYSVNFYLAQNFTINKNLRAEVTGFYQSALVYGIFEIDPRYSVDLGVSLRVMDGLGSLKFSAKDVFGTMDNDVSVNQGSIDLKVHSSWESRRANVSFNYNFGNQKVKKARNRKTATSDEENRVSKGNN